MTTLSIIVASRGERPSLARTLESISTQMLPGDELLVGVDENSLCGYRTRQELMHRARGEALLFMDDDDVYTPGAFEIIRRALYDAPDDIHLFRMDTTCWVDSIYDHVWHTRGDFVVGNVASQIACTPRHLWLGSWGSRYEGDWDFLSSTAALNPDSRIVWHDDVICLVRPA